MPQITALPGTLTPHEQQQWLKHLVARMCQIDKPRYVRRMFVLVPNFDFMLPFKVSRQPACEFYNKRPFETGKTGVCSPSFRDG